MKLSYRRTFFIGLAFMSICAFWQLYDNIIPLILKNTFGIGEVYTGIIMALDNVLALFLLPLFGALSDRVDTRFGKRTPFIVIGTALAVLFSILLPVADSTQNLVLFIVLLGFVLLSMGFYRSPAVALMPDLTPKPLRSKANSIINLMGAIGGVYTLVMIKLLIDDKIRPDYMPVFLSVNLFMVVSVIILILTIKEKKLASNMPPEATDTDNKQDERSDLESKRTLSPEVRKSLIFLLSSVFLWFTAYNAVTTAFSRYAVEVWGLSGGDFADCLMVATIAAIVSYIPVGFISERIGRKKVIITGILLMIAAFTSGALFVTYSPFLNVIFAVTGIGWAAINVNSYPMVVQMSRGSDIGKYTGFYYTFSMAAQIFTPIFSGFLLEHISYRTLFPYSAIFSFIALLTMLFVKHGDVKRS
ncbi:MAG: SLC45 family MFS transporter [Clostridiales bacterium]|nr:SLC45 family MFS transporter [Clostridiales bacterium]